MALSEETNMDKSSRNQRLVFITRTLLENPGTLFSLNYFLEQLGAAKSSISEDLALIKEILEAGGTGAIETQAGATGGVRYWPVADSSRGNKTLEELCRVLSTPDRIIPGGYLYMADVIFSPVWSARAGELIASHYLPLSPDHVLTVETKGIPLALMTARVLNLPLVTARREARVTEGSAVSINFVSGSTRRIQTMSLGRRALPRGARVLIVDDFMKAGGTARGLQELAEEFDARVVGTAVFVETAEPARKLVSDYLSLLVLEGVDEETRTVTIRPSRRWSGRREDGT